MANTLLPVAERNLTPDQVEALDKRREWGLTLQVIAGQFSVACLLLSLWVGQDLTYSPGWAHPMAYYMAVAVTIVLVCGTVGTILRHGSVPPRLIPSGSTYPKRGLSDQAAFLFAH